MTENPTCDCTTHEEEKEATTTVRFPRSDEDVERNYCDRHIRHLLQAGVAFEGVSEHA